MTAPASGRRSGVADTEALRSDSADSSTAIGPSAGERLRGARGPVLLAALVLAAGVVLALLSARPSGGTLQPDSAEPQGSLALATLLGEQGVVVDTVTDLPPADPRAMDPDRTVLVAHPERLSTPQRDTLARSRADLVLVAPDAAALEAVARGVTEVRSAAPEVTAPACPLRAATAAGPVDLTGSAYTAPPGAVSCYRADGSHPADGGASLVVVRAGDRSVTVVGDPTPFTNAALDQRGNAALTMGLLGAHRHLDWYLPVPPPAAPGQQRGLLELLPAGWLWGALQLLVAGFVVAAWRGRRLGPLVAERLPVIVRADETTRGRARLYRHTGARDRAGEALRSAARRDLATRLGVPRSSGSAEPAVLVDAVASRTGRSAAAVADLLGGPAPADDRALVELASALDLLAGEVARSHDRIK